MPYIEDFMIDGLTSVVGDGLVTGILILGFFAIFVMLQGTRIESKIMVLIPMAFLLGHYFNTLFVLMAFFVTAIVFYGLMRFINK